MANCYVDLSAGAITGRARGVRQWVPEYEEDR